MNSITYSLSTFATSIDSGSCVLVCCMSGGVLTGTCINAHPRCEMLNYLTVAC